MSRAKTGQDGRPDKIIIFERCSTLGGNSTAKRLKSTVVVRKWGASHGFVIPKVVVKKMDIEAGETLLVTFEKV